jgi:hypothetical protein
MMLKFRPSSHSTDLTVIGTFKSAKEAKNFEKKLRTFVKQVDNGVIGQDFDWDGSNASVFRRGKRVYFNTETNGKLDEVETLMYSDPSIKNVSTCEDYQELTVTLHIDKKLQLKKVSDALALILSPEDVTLIRELNKECGKPKMRLDPQTKQQEFVWHYEGESVYEEDECILFGIEIRDLERWNVWC